MLLVDVEVIIEAQDMAPAVIRQYPGFHQAIQEDREPVATGMDGLRVVQVTLAMIQSAREGRTVKIEPVDV